MAIFFSLYQAWLLNENYSKNPASMIGATAISRQERKICVKSLIWQASTG